MNEKRKLLTRLQQIISEQLGVRQEEITEKSAWAHLGADSLDRLEMTRVFEDAFKVEIPHQIGEQLNTVGETVDHLWTLTAAQNEISNIRIEAAATTTQWDEISGIRTQVFTSEYGFTFRPLPGTPETGVWHFLARDRQDAIGTISVVDTTGAEIHQRYRLSFGENERVARYAQLAILKPYRKRGIFKMLIEAAQSTVIRPKRFSVGWLLYPAAHTRSSVLTQSLGFTAEEPVLPTEFGNCHVLVRRESSLPQVEWNEDSLLAFSAAG